MNTNSNKKAMMGTEYQENKLPSRLLAVSEVASFLGVHSSTVRRWEKRGLLKSYVIGLRHNLRFKQEDVLKFLDESHKEGACRVSSSSSLYREGPKSSGRGGKLDGRSKRQG